MSTRECKDCHTLDFGSLYRKGNGRCKYCRGTGERLDEHNLVYGILTGKSTCVYCTGTGQCQTCGGEGVIYIDDYVPPPPVRERIRESDSYNRSDTNSYSNVSYRGSGKSTPPSLSSILIKAVYCVILLVVGYHTISYIYASIRLKVKNSNIGRAHDALVSVDWEKHPRNFTKTVTVTAAGFSPKRFADEAIYFSTSSDDIEIYISDFDGSNEHLYVSDHRGHILPTPHQYRFVAKPGTTAIVSYTITPAR